MPNTCLIHFTSGLWRDHVPQRFPRQYPAQFQAVASPLSGQLSCHPLILSEFYCVILLIWKKFSYIYFIFYNRLKNNSLSFTQNSVLDQCRILGDTNRVILKSIIKNKIETTGSLIWKLSKLTTRASFIAFDRDMTKFQITVTSNIICPTFRTLNIWPTP